VIGAFGGGHVQVPAGIDTQPYAAAHARLLEGVPASQVAGQPVKVADDDHLDPARLDRRDQLPEPIAGDFLNREYLSSLKGGRDGPAAPGRVVGARSIWVGTGSVAT